MKKFVMIIRKFFSALGAFVYPGHLISHIKGSIYPANGVKKVWAINDNDAVFVIPESGKFFIAVPPGKWKLHVEAMNPYQYAVVDNISVAEGSAADAGVIRLKPVTK